ncbi:MAG: DUF1857 family protein [Myxococcales bacterium]|nr:DUF1857 family protein [Myxococcales bacterium]
MFSVEKTLPVNDGVGPNLTRSEVWAGLVMKGENALPFVPIMKRCEVQERGENWLVREIQIGDEIMHERVTFRPEHTVVFQRLDGVERGTIVNEILEENGALVLRFRFELSREDMADGSDEEKAYAEGMEGTYLKAVQSTLETIRRLRA